MHISISYIYHIFCTRKLQYDLLYSGRGKWKEIATMIPTRPTIQVKTHAQQVMKRADLGEDVYAEFQMQEGPSSTSSTQSTRTLQNDRQARVVHGFYVNTKSSSVSNTIIDALKEYDSLSQQDQGAAYILCQMAQPKALCRVL